MNTTRLVVDGMVGTDAVASVEQALQTVPGVIRVRPVPADKAVDVEAAETVTPGMLIAALASAGFDSSLSG